MTRLSAWKMIGAVFMFCGVTAIVTPAQTFNTLVNFDGGNGTAPYFVSLTQNRGGKLYGTTSIGGANNQGTIFTLTPDGKLTTVYNFCSQTNCPDGRYPTAGVVLAADGNFYGETKYGGPSDSGTIFEISPDNTLTTIYVFCFQTNCPDGQNPVGGLIQAADGDFYGVTFGGGANGAGTVFRISAKGALTTLYSFCPDRFFCTDGEAPEAGLVQAADGQFYGTTASGGTSSSCNGPCGTVFKITSRGTLTTLHSFNVTDGYEPTAELVQGTDGNFYGTTPFGGASDFSGYGTAYKITRGGVLTTLHSFCTGNTCSDGFYPYAGLIQATDGNLYGTTAGTFSNCGGSGSCGTIYDITPGGSLTTLHTFDSSEGTTPYGAVTQATNGKFYGTTFEGGPVNGGTVFSIDTDLGPFVTFVRPAGKVGQTGGILGQGFTGTTSVILNGVPASFTVVSDTFIRATVPAGATTGYVTVTTPSGTLTSNVPFHVIP
jgi:uncharacterized repeat protein (TIGR03803 family)